MSLVSADIEILQTAINWIEAGYQPAMVTVAKTWGSSPRSPGSLMLMRDDGQYVGSVSGGCVETDLIQHYVSGELAKLPTVVDYGVDRLRASRLGLPCGGRLELVVEQLDQIASLQSILNAISNGQLLTRRLCLNTGEVSLHRVNAATEFDYQQQTVQKVFGPGWFLLLIGAGQLASYVAQIAITLGYQVTVCDPRDTQAHWFEPSITFTQQMPDEAVLQLANQPRAAIITLAHDPKLDDMALLEALPSNAFFVGSLGSRRTNEQRRKRLAEMGLEQPLIQRLYSPVGLDIGSHTPAEIAVSIMAQVTAVRNGMPTT